MSESLERLLAEEIRREGYELYHWVLRPAGKRRVLQIFVHGEQGVGLDDCARVSRRLGAVIEDSETVEGSYVLEVSSPGVDRQLLKRRHFELAEGSRIRLVERREDGDRSLEGILTGVDEDAIRLETKGGEERLPLGSIDKARVVPEISTRRD